MDKIDFKILKILEKDGRITNSDLSEKVGLSKTPCQLRVKSLIKSGISNRLINEEAIIESLMCFRRAGASAIVSYFALDIAKKIKS